MKKYNVIFTGHFLKIWYVLCIVIVFAMIWNNKKLRNVDSFDMTLYDSSGAVALEKQIPAQDVELYMQTFSKVFRPIK